jgi:hypothetical protein
LTLPKLWSGRTPSPLPGPGRGVGWKESESKGHNVEETARSVEKRCKVNRAFPHSSHFPVMPDEPSHAHLRCDNPLRAAVKDCAGAGVTLA